MLVERLPRMESKKGETPWSASETVAACHVAESATQSSRKTCKHAHGTEIGTCSSGRENCSPRDSFANLQMLKR